jgi:predicted dithiol-disulfide oxidoreductase (DUF899 family)
VSQPESPALPAPSMCQPVGEFEVVSRETWNEARQELLEEEKALMKVRDRLIAKRRRLPVTESTVDIVSLARRARPTCWDFFGDAGN